MIYKAAHIDIVIVIKQFLSTENDFHTHNTKQIYTIATFQIDNAMINDEGMLILPGILHKHISFRKFSKCSKNAITFNHKSTSSLFKIDKIVFYYVYEWKKRATRTGMILAHPTQLNLNFEIWIANYVIETYKPQFVLNQP